MYCRLKQRVESLGEAGLAQADWKAGKLECFERKVPRKESKCCGCLERFRLYTAALREERAHVFDGSYAQLKAGGVAKSLELCGGFWTDPESSLNMSTTRHIRQPSPH